MNGQFDLRIITQPHSEVYCGYFRRLVFGNSLTFSHIPPCFHAKPPDFPRLFEPHVSITKHGVTLNYSLVNCKIINENFENYLRNIYRSCDFGGFDLVDPTSQSASSCAGEFIMFLLFSLASDPAPDEVLEVLERLYIQLLCI